MSPTTHLYVTDRGATRTVEYDEAVGLDHAAHCKRGKRCC